MKNLKHLVMLAAALVLGFTSCNNDDVIPENNGEAKTLSFSITQDATSRAEVPSQGEESVEFNGGTLFFTTSTGIIVKKYTIGDATADFTLAQATAGVTITGVPGTATGATLVGNTDLTALPNGVGEEGRQIQNVKAYAICVANQSNIKNVNLYGEALGFNKVGNLYECVINLKPTVARVELSDIRGNADIASFKVEGIFIDEFYEKAQISGAVITGSFENFANGQTGDADKFRPGNEGKYEHYTALYDWYASTLASAANIVAPATGNIWGYNLFANNSATPHIIIRLKDVMVNVRNAEGVITGTKLHPASEGGKPSFVTIRGFIDVNKTTGFEAGYVYTVEAGAWSFGPEHVTEEPDMKAIDVKVTVTVAKWIPKKVLPEL